MFNHSNKPFRQPVKFVEILPIKHSQVDSHGESDMKEDDLKKEDVIERLANHIEILANIGNQNHQDRNFEMDKKESGQWNMLKGAENNITRVNQYEFSLYPKMPLTIDQFKTLQEKIANIAAKCHQNLHLLLSSIPIEIDGKILNCIMYVECGEKPIITLIAKRYASDIDISYSKPLFQVTGKSKEKLDKLGITTDPTFEFTTAGKMLVNIAVEICHDHGHGHAKDMLLKKLEMRESKEIIPRLVTHVISSNSVRRTEDNMLTELVTYVDPVGPKIINIKNNFLNLDFSSAQKVTGKYPITQHGATISANFKDIINVSKSPFGHDYSMYISSEYTVRKFTNKQILSKINSLYESARLIELKKIYEEKINIYLQNPKLVGKKRKESIEEINKFIVHLNSQNDKKHDRVDLLLGCLLAEADKAQDQQTRKFFKRSDESKLALLLNSIVTDFVKKEELGERLEFYVSKFDDYHKNKKISPQPNRK